MVPVSAAVSEEWNRGSVSETSRRFAETEAEGASGSHYGVEGVTGDAARVLAVSNDAHVAAFPPAGPPTTTTHKGFIKIKNVFE